MSNLAYRDNYKEELINGELILMSPCPSINHNRIIGNIYMIFAEFLDDKNCEDFICGVVVYIDKENIVVPDLVIVCSEDDLNGNRIDNIPSLLVEVLSPSTAKRDKGYKKSLYEKHGIQEYWIVSPEEMSVEVNILKEEKYKVDSIYYSKR